MRSGKAGLAAALFFALVPAYACLPLPPATADGKAAPAQPAPEQRLQEVLKNPKDLAVVTVVSDTQQETNAFAILKITHGWGEAKRQMLTYPREESVCGPLQKLPKDASYLVVLDYHKVVEIFDYALARKSLKALGAPDYKYNKKGVLKKATD
jgi:hypothetical protein